MRRLILFLATTCVWAQVSFRDHVIEPKIPGGYALLVVDLNKDGRPDVIGLTSRLTELAWYENPTWERHVLVKDQNGLVNLAAHDLDGDGIPELAVETEFSMVAAKSQGLVWILEHQGDPRQAWKTRKIDALITSHHVGWADVDGDGKKELINAPLIGPKGLAPTYDQDLVPLVFYQTGLAVREQSLHGTLEATVREAVEEAERLCTRYGIAFHASGASSPLQSLAPEAGSRPWAGCQRPWTVSYVTANGNVLPCCISPWTAKDYKGAILGNAFHEPLAELWNGERYQSFRTSFESDTPPDPCRECGSLWSI